MDKKIHTFEASEIKFLAESGESTGLPGAFLTGANSSERSISSTAIFLQSGNTSKMNVSSLMPLFAVGFTVDTAPSTVDTCGIFLRATWYTTPLPRFGITVSRKKSKV
jgi:hypothetical protein